MTKFNAVKAWLVLHATCVWARLCYWAGVTWHAVRPWANKAAEDVSEKAEALKQDIAKAIDDAPAHTKIGWYGVGIFVALVLVMAVAVVCVREIFPLKEIRPAVVELTPDQQLAELRASFATQADELAECKAYAAELTPKAPPVTLLAAPDVVTSVSPAKVSSSEPVRAEPVKRKAKRKPKPKPAPTIFDAAFWK